MYPKDMGLLYISSVLLMTLSCLMCLHWLDTLDIPTADNELECLESSSCSLTYSQKYGLLELRGAPRPSS